jgi:hypothetical protein
MNTSATLLDVGLARAEVRLAQMARNAEHSVQSTSAFYQFDDDKIIFVWTVPSSADAKEACDAFLKSAELGYLPASSGDEELDALIGVVAENAKSAVPGWFLHQGFEHRDQPNDLANEVAKRIELVCLSVDQTGRRRFLEREISWADTKPLNR